MQPSKTPFKLILHLFLTTTSHTFLLPTTFPTLNLNLMIPIYSDIDNLSLNHSDLIGFKDFFDAKHKIPIENFNYLQIWITNPYNKHRTSQSTLLVRISKKPFKNPNRFSHVTPFYYFNFGQSKSLIQIHNSRCEFLDWISKARKNAKLPPPQVFQKQPKFL